MWAGLEAWQQFGKRRLAGKNLRRKLTPERRTECGLTDQEKLMLQSRDWEIFQHHQHFDSNKLIEDCLKELPLATGLYRCGSPRNQSLWSK